jgi:tetratricopeptide (TPR) repeat protein
MRNPWLFLGAVALAGVLNMPAAAAQQDPKQADQSSAGASGQTSQQQGSGDASRTSSADQQSPNDIPSPDAAPDAGQHSADQQADEQKPSRAQRAKEHVKKQMSSWCVGAPLNHCWEKQSKDDNDADSQIPPAPRSDDNAQPSDLPTLHRMPGTNSAPPEQPGESSSKDTRIDLSPPTGDDADHPDSAPDIDSAADTGTTEMHAWNPHRAMKNIEVGDFYYKQHNYRAAISRYQEALQWKPRDAEATYKLADAWDKVGNTEAARQGYMQYLSILPKGPHAEEATKALARLK